MANPTEALKITKRELDAYFAENQGLSDIQEPCVYEGREYKPAIEWDGPWGKHWQSFETEAEMLERLHQYDMDICRWVVAYRTRGGVSEQELWLRAEKKKRADEKAKLAHERKVARTLGGNFPVLQQLLIEARKEQSKTK